MGSADIIPGVSGGTMALILKIYNRLIHAISSFDLSFLKSFFTFRWQSAFSRVHWKFLAALLSGIIGAIAFFTRVVPLQLYMFTHPELIYGLFFGLIIGSIGILIKAIDNFSWKHVLWVLGGILIGLWVVTRVPAETPESPWFIFLSGCVAICAMVLPGISGSYILLILRKYDFILSQLGKIGSSDTVSALLVLAPFVVGALVGLMLFTRLLSWLLDTRYAKTLAVLIGFLIGSLYVIWPYQHRTYSTFVTDTEVVEYGSPRALAIRNNPPNKKNPGYQRLGDIMPPHDIQGTPRRVEIETIEQKLVKSEPYIPFLSPDSGNNKVGNGIYGMLMGLVLVFGLEKLQKKEEQVEAEESNLS